MTSQENFNKLFSQDHFPPLFTQRGSYILLDEWTGDIQPCLSQWREGLSTRIDDLDTPTEDYETAFELLAEWGRGYRQAKSPDQELRAAQELAFGQLDEIVKTHHRRLCQLAISVPNCFAWRRDVIALSTNPLRDLTHYERSRAATALLVIEDDTQLVAFAMKHFESRYANKLLADLALCHLCFLEHIDCFLFADSFIRLTAASLCLEKLNSDINLYSTAVKWVALLAALRKSYGEQYLESLSDKPQNYTVTLRIETSTERKLLLELISKHINWDVMCKDADRDIGYSVTCEQQGEHQ